MLRYDAEVNLVRSARDHDNLDDLRSTLAELDAALSQRAAEIARTQSDLAAFRLRYRQEVGLLHEELDDLQREISAAELNAISQRVEDDAAGTAASSVPSPAPLPRFTSDGVRKLFRDVAKTIHPDLALDEATRDRRHRLMVEANRAYALGDEERLRRVLEAWESSPEAVPGSDPEATRQRLLRRIAQIQEQLDVSASELAEMTASPLWQLKVLVDEGAARGKDLMRDMIARLKRDIMAARNRLDAIRWVP
jgi:hypothetical protein